MAEAIEGVVLGELVTVVENEIVEAKKELARKQIRAIYGDVTKWSQEKRNAEKQVQQIAERISKAVEKIEKLKRGDWSALPNPEPASDKTDKPTETR